MAEVEDGAPVVLAKAPEEAEALPAAEEVGAVEVGVADHKRKHGELEEVEKEAGKDEAAVADVEVVGDGGTNGVEEEEKVEDEDVEGKEDAKRQRVETALDVSGEGGNQEEELKADVPIVENGTVASTENNEQPAAAEGGAEPVALVPEHGEAPPTEQQTVTEVPAASRKIEVPNNKVGVLIGKAGDTIRFLQYNSGAKIQITRDADSDPYSTTRPVELIGSLECINKAEQLIKDVIAEAEAGGSPALVARGFGTAQSGAEQLEIQVPNEKVGLIIGKGGETIKSLQTRSGARIQLIPQHLPEGDPSKVRTVRISGNKKQIETATEMIQEVMNQDERLIFLLPGRPSSVSSGYNQQAYRPRGPTPPQWGPRAVHPSQAASGYGYQQRGMYPSHTQQYPSPFGGYQQQPPSRGGYGAGWDQRPAQAPPQAGGYDYYGQGGPPTDSQPSGHLSAPNASGPTPSQGGYYGQPQGPGYGQPAPYVQSMPTQQNYGHGYNEPKYDAQAQSQQQIYGQQPPGGQPGPYSQYQQPYNKPPYAGVPSQGPPQSYGQPRPNQPGDQMYQGPPPNYGPGGPSQQPYAYGSGGQPVPAYNQPYGGSAGTADGYMQPSSGYAQPGGPAAAGYAQAGQAAPTFPQAAQSGGYGQYQQPQPNYSEQPVLSNTPGYGYQGAPTDPAYGNSTPSAGYGATAPAGQAGYVQPAANPSGYEQPVQPQAGYGSYPGSAPASYT